MLVNFSNEHTLWTSRHYFLDVCIFGLGMLLASFRQYVVAYVHCKILPWAWNWTEIGDCADLCCRNNAASYPWGIGDAVADVDRVRNNAVILPLSTFHSISLTCCSGYVADLMFYKVPDTSGIVGLNWRIMMASAMFPALIVICFVFMCPESPRWYMSKGRHFKAYQAMCQLRYSKVQAARDLFYMHTLLEAEKDVQQLHGNPILELVRVPRNRRAMLASEIVMFMQQVRAVHVNATVNTDGLSSAA